jgi:hypothetical protein
VHLHEVGLQKEACFRLFLPDSFLSIALELSLIFIGMSFHAQPSIPFRLDSLTLGSGDKTFPVSSALIILIYLSASNRTAIKIT